MSQPSHCIAVIGGAVSGAEVAGTLAERGVEVAVFEQNPRPYGKVEDGLPRWHVALREISDRDARVKEAESLRARVTSCDQAVELAREYREVVVKNRVRRLSSDLAPNLQKLLESLPDGRMTPPEPTLNTSSATTSTHSSAPPPTHGTGWQCCCCNPVSAPRASNASGTHTRHCAQPCWTPSPGCSSPSS